MMELNKQNFNVTYHPIMDNYKKYENVEKSFLSDEEKVTYTGCKPEEGVMLISHLRVIDYEMVTANFLLNDHN